MITGAHAAADYSFSFVCKFEFIDFIVVHSHMHFNAHKSSHWSVWGDELKNVNKLQNKMFIHSISW